MVQCSFYLLLHSCRFQTRYIYARIDYIELLIGIGIFQIPAGILAAKYGPRKIAIYGILITSSYAAFLSGLSTDLHHMIILRFIVGLGMAFFFGPSVILISKDSRESIRRIRSRLTKFSTCSRRNYRYFWMDYNSRGYWLENKPNVKRIVRSNIWSLISCFVDKRKDTDRFWYQIITYLRQILFNKSLIVLQLALSWFSNRIQPHLDIYCLLSCRSFESGILK